MCLMRFFLSSGVRFNDMKVANARFLGTSAEVAVSGRKPYFYVYDTLSGGMSKIPGTALPQSCAYCLRLI